MVYAVMPDCPVLQVMLVSGVLCGDTAYISQMGIAY
jgi:hypothetical protein